MGCCINPHFGMNITDFGKTLKRVRLASLKILLLVMVMVGCLSSKELFKSSKKPTFIRDTWVSWIEACEI
jgi:hypothetical protein